MIAKQVNQKAWFMVLPVFLIVAFSAVIPTYDRGQLLLSGYLRQ